MHVVPAQGCLVKAKKLPKLSPETKADIEAFEAKLEAAAVERHEEQATAKAALQHSSGAEDMDTDTGTGASAILCALVSHWRQFVHAARPAVTVAGAGTTELALQHSAGSHTMKTQPWLLYFPFLAQLDACACSSHLPRC